MNFKTYADISKMHKRIEEKHIGKAEYKRARMEEEVLSDERYERDSKLAIHQKFFN